VEPPTGCVLTFFMRMFHLGRLYVGHLRLRPHLKGDVDILWRLDVEAWDRFYSFLEEKSSLLGLFHCTCGLTTFIFLCFRLLSCDFNFLS
jgi:hypothetical protein